MTTRLEVLEAVEDSETGDWEMYDRVKTQLVGDSFTSQVWVYDYDVNIRIESGPVNVEDFNQEWTDSYPGECESRQYNIFYQQSPVEELNIVFVDGYRAAIPVPESPESDDGSWTISGFEDTIGGIISHNAREYRLKKETGGIEVR